MKQKWCKGCHFETNYNHYDSEKGYYEKVDYHTGERSWDFEYVEVFKGNWSDANGYCLPCQAMRRFNC